MPSETPSVSDWPTSQPSSQPSSMPSENPSISSAPSSQPSYMPSSMPSSQPSEQPSSIPSSMPSSQPSSMPSSQPSGQPSSIPSTAPSSAPSESPSLQPSVSLRPSLTYYKVWYPDQSGPGAESCRRDGAELQYMKDNPDYYLFDNAEECCQRHFQWSIQECRRQSLGTPKYYPDLSGVSSPRSIASGHAVPGPGGCKADGREPYDFKLYPGYLFDTLEECCNHHYGWNLSACLNPDLAEDPCSSVNAFNLYENGYDEGFLLESEVGYYPVCKSPVSHHC